MAPKIGLSACTKATACVQYIHMTNLNLELLCTILLLYTMNSLEVSNGYKFQSTHPLALLQTQSCAWVPKSAANYYIETVMLLKPTRETKSWNCCSLQMLRVWVVQRLLQPSFPSFDALSLSYTFFVSIHGQTKICLIGLIAQLVALIFALVTTHGGRSNHGERPQSYEGIAQPAFPSRQKSNAKYKRQKFRHDRFHQGCDRNDQIFKILHGSYVAQCAKHVAVFVSHCCKRKNQMRERIAYFCGT